VALVNACKNEKVIFYNFLLTFIFLELGLRLIGKRAPTYSEYKSQAASGYYATSKSNTFTLKKNYSRIQKNQNRNLKNEPETIALQTDGLGFRRTISFPKSCKSLDTVLMLGDSYAFGIYIRDQDTIPSVKQRLANISGKRLRVINAGYANGHEADQVHAWLYQNIDLIKPKLVIYNFYAGNDIRGIDKSSWKDLTPKGLP
jgi:hypothetical protein